MIEGVAFYFTVIVVIVNLLVDLSYGWLNPKVRAA
jgi:peptide/nickel transport system permease protein